MKEQLTFSQKVKNEIIESTNKLLPCCMLSFLSAVSFASEISITSGGVGFCLNSANLPFVKFVAGICNKLYGFTGDILAESGSNGRVNYSLTVTHTQLLFDCGLLYRDGQGLTQIAPYAADYLLEQDCCKKSFIVATFLADGNVVVPKIENSTTGYKLEFSLSTKAQSDLLLSLLSHFGFAFKFLERKSSFSVYIQESDAVCDMLIFLGASESMLSLENVKVELAMRSQANRQANCVMANIDKSVAAAQQQITAIKLLIEKGKMNFIDEKLQEMANARMENPDAIMAELADILKISKSGANHRMRKLLSLAEELTQPNPPDA